MRARRSLKPSLESIEDRIALSHAAAAAPEAVTSPRDSRAALQILRSNLIADPAPAGQVRQVGLASRPTVVAGHSTTDSSSRQEAAQLRQQQRQERIQERQASKPTTTGKPAPKPSSSSSGFSLDKVFKSIFPW